MFLALSWLNNKLQLQIVAVIISKCYRIFFKISALTPPMKIILSCMRHSLIEWREEKASSQHNFCQSFLVDRLPFEVDQNTSWWEKEFNPLILPFESSWEIKKLKSIIRYATLKRMSIIETSEWRISFFPYKCNLVEKWDSFSEAASCLSLLKTIFAKFA